MSFEKQKKSQARLLILFQQLLSSLAVSAQPEIPTRNTLNNGALVGGGDSFLSSSNDKNKQVGVISPPNKAVSSNSVLNSNTDNFYHSLLNDDNKLLEDFRSVSLAQVCFVLAFRYIKKCCSFR